MCSHTPVRCYLCMVIYVLIHVNFSLAALVPGTKGRLAAFCISQNHRVAWFGGTLKII